MNGKYIVRQQIKDRNGGIIGYEILYHGENQAYSGESAESNDLAAADTIYNFLTQNTEKVLKGSLNFMTFTSTLLMKKTPNLFDKSELCIQIDDSVVIHPLSMNFLKQYADEGYKIAVNEFQFSPRYLALMDSIDYIKINAKTTTDTALKSLVEVAHSMNKLCIATEVDSPELYEKTFEFGVDYFEGSYISERLMAKAHSSAYLRSSVFQVMVAVSKEEPDVDEIERLISMDAGLTYGLLKMANSVQFAQRNRVTTVRQAMMALGMGQMRQWIYLLSASGSDNKIDAAAEEFLKLSFMRASFCSELMNHVKDMPIAKPDAYLLGMFSTLNYLIDAPLEEILDEIPIRKEVREALLERSGRCGLLYELVLSYEAADWSKITELAEELGIPDNLLTNIYFICMESVNTLWSQLTSVYSE